MGSGRESPLSLPSFPLSPVPLELTITSPLVRLRRKTLSPSSQHPTTATDVETKPLSSRSTTLSSTPCAFRSPFVSSAAVELTFSPLFVHAACNSTQHPGRESRWFRGDLLITVSFASLSTPLVPRSTR